MTVLLPGATLGVMGGGQLGRMFVHAAQRMGYFTAVLDPDEASPAGRVSHHHVQADYLDEIGLARLSGFSAAITTEFENVPADALARLAEKRPVAPRRWRSRRIAPRRRRTSCAAACPARRMR